MSRCHCLRSEAVVALLAVAVCSVTLAQEQPAGNDKPPASKAPTPATRIALIDMSHVFKNYRKFDVLRSAMKTEIAAAELKARPMAAEIQRLEERLGKLSAGSDEHAEVDQQLLKRKAEFESFRKSTQRDFLRQEAEIYKTIYLEVADAVRARAKADGYDLVLRFSRDEVGDASDPKELIQEMMRDVVFYNPDADITDAIVETLNAGYDAESR